MRRDHSTAQAAWRRPALGLSSFSCMGPHCRAMVDAHSNCTEEVNSSKCSAFAIEESSEHVYIPGRSCMGLQFRTDLLVSSPVSKMTPDSEGDADNDSDEDHHRPGNSMNEVELWQQLEHELCDRTDREEADLTDEEREEEEEGEEMATVEEETNSQTLSLAPKVKEVHRFFPPVRIMHIVTLNSSSPRKCEENEASPTSSSCSDNSQPDDETTIGIFQTSRSLHCKVRLSQTMMSDHFMPVYIRKI